MNLTPGTPITVIDRDGRPARERVMSQHMERIYIGNGLTAWATDEAFVLEHDQGVTWAIGWDTEDARAFAAQLLLRASG